MTTKTTTPKTTKLPKKIKPRSRGQRWLDAVMEAQYKLTEVKKTLEAVTSAQSDLHGALEAIQEIQGEYQEWRDNLPEGLENSPVAEKLEAVTELDIESAMTQAENDVEEALELSEIEDLLSEAEGLDLPLGFGRD